MICVLLVHVFSGSIKAAVITWDGGGADNTWAVNANGGKNANWTGNEKPPTNGDSLVFSGTTRLSNTNNIANLSIADITFSTGPFVLSGQALTLTGNITNNSSSLQTINMALGLSAGDHTLATTSGNMTIAGNLTGAGANLIKTGANQLNLTGTASYTGNTTVSQGTLSYSNSYSVNSSATMGGAGTIAMQGSASLSVNGKIAPGNGTTPGTLTINLSSTTGGVTMNSGASFEFHLGTANVSDMLAIAGAASGDVAFNNNNINFMGTGVAGVYKLFDTSSNNANTWTGLTVNAGGQITAGLAYSGLAGGYTANLFMGGNSYGGDSGDIYVQVVIPEPSTALLGGLGALTLLLRRRRSNK